MWTNNSLGNIINHFISFHFIPFSRYDVTKKSRLSYPRVTANRSDLTLQGGPNQHGTYWPVGLYEPTILLPTSNYRTAPPTYSQPSPTRDHQK